MASLMIGNPPGYSNVFRSVRLLELHLDQASIMRLFAGTQFDQPPHCERCGELDSECQCPEPVAEPMPPEKQSAKIRLEKRKKGKWVTTISGLDATGNHLTELLTNLKNYCGAGGTIQDEVLEIQGDHMERVAVLLKKIGYGVKT